MTNYPHDDSAFDFLKDVDGERNRPAGVSPARSARLQPDLGFDLDGDADSSDPPEDMQTRLERVLAATNPLREAVQPLLRILAEMPASMESQAAVERLRALLVREVVTFQKVCDKANLPWKHMAAVRYCICTALDEAANRTRWGGGGVWAAKSLLITFEGEVDGGEKFFLLIGRMATDPQAYIDVLEVLYRILGLGFEGRYSVIVDGRRHLEQIRQRLLTLISGVRDPAHLELSPHWRGEAPGKMNPLRGVPVWATAGIGALLVFALFGWFKYHLLWKGDALEARILEIGSRPVPPPVTPPAPARKPLRLRLSVLLKEEIARGLVTVVEDDVHSHVIFRGDYMFVPGKATVRPEIEPVLARVGQEVARVEGRVTVTGHSDSQRIHTPEFPDNQVLSEKRAALIASVLESQGTAAARIQAIGAGDTQPLADNATSEGRARNRRVEILVTE
ncbi:MAG TPA: type VI secretion system protein TssL, long form [Paraburkholderia sp.]|jgi:type VI secretion system protein ImpK|nr:type VI secretion system protein TssL, long form [Paraburkholderia sp.]